MKRRSAWRAGAVALLLTLLAASCGDSEAESTTTSGAFTTTTTPTSTTSTSSATSTTETTTTTTTTTVPTQTVEVVFASGDGSDCGEVTAFERDIDAALEPIPAAFELLVAGPTVAEMAQGAGSFFSDESSGALRSLTLEIDDSLLVVDFRDIRQLLSNASTSCGSESLLAQLNGTAFQFEAVERVRYEIDGSCDVFSNWLQRECTEYTRQGAQPVDLPTNERALGSGCTPGPGSLPDGRWFGYVVEAGADEISFDLACWFTGTAAADAAAEDGEESPPPNDYYVRNVSEQKRAVAVAAQPAVTWLPTADPADAATIDYADWVAQRPSRAYLPGVWLEVVEGAVVSIEEQYVP